MEFLSLNLSNVSKIKVQTNDKDPKSLVKTLKRSGFVPSDGSGQWRGLGGGGDKTSFAVAAADPDDIPGADDNPNLSQLTRIVKLLDRLCDHGWKVCASAIFGSADENAHTVFLRKSGKLPTTRSSHGFFLDGGETQALVVPAASLRELDVEELKSGLEEVLASKEGDKIESNPYGDGYVALTLPPPPPPPNDEQEAKSTGLKKLRDLQGSSGPGELQILDRLIRRRIDILQCLTLRHFRLDFSFSINDDGEEGSANVVVFSRKVTTPDTPPSNQKLFGLCATPTGVRLFEPPPAAAEIVQRDFVNSIAWRKTDAIWQRRSRDGKKLVMLLTGRFRLCGYGWLATLDGFYRNGVLLFGGPSDDELIPVPPSNAPTPAPMMALTVSSAKKLMPDFNVAQYYSANPGRRGQHHTVASALHALEECNGHFEQAERIVRFPDGHFELNSSGNADWNLLKILDVLYRAGWGVFGSCNVSGRDKAPVFVSHTLFFMRGQPIQLNKELRQARRPRQPPPGMQQSQARPPRLRKRVGEWMAKNNSQQQQLQEQEQEEDVTGQEVTPREQPQEQENQQETQETEARGEDDEQQQRRRRNRHRRREPDPNEMLPPPSYDDVMAAEPGSLVERAK